MNSQEPVALAELVRAVLVALVALGWATIDNTAIDAAVSAVALLASWVLAAITRSRVTPVTPPGAGQ